MVSHATVIGRSHRLMQHNCQDFAIAAVPTPNVAFGLICDGCGSKFRTDSRTLLSHNEIGANLLSQFAADFLTGKLKQNKPIANNSDKVEAILSQLYAASLDFLRDLTALFPYTNGREIVATRLLTTLVGFVKMPGAAVFFWQGDGFLAVDGRVCQLNSGNQPNYLAYQLLQPNPTQSNFHLAFVPQPEKIRWLAVATDGWTADQLRQLAEPRSALALQRWLNVQAQQRGQFDDDGAVAIWSRA